MVIFCILARHFFKHSFMLKVYLVNSLSQSTFLVKEKVVFLIRYNLFVLFVLRQALISCVAYLSDSPI